LLKGLIVLFSFGLEFRPFFCCHARYIVRIILTPVIQAPRAFRADPARRAPL
jgi:hypothetical protein